MWGGSEELWTQSANSFLHNGYEVFSATYYQHQRIDALKEQGIHWATLGYQKSISLRMFHFLLKKMKLRTGVADNAFLTILSKTKPEFVVISQGNNIDAKECMLACQVLNIPYVTITQLVTEFSWLWIKDQEIQELINGYNRAERNYFVSLANKELNDLMLGEVVKNTQVIFNPFDTKAAGEVSYPSETEGLKIAVVGRLECMHKGLDLIIQVLKKDKWRERDVVVTFYGGGPHLQLLQRMIANSNIVKVRIAGHVQDKMKIWNDNHILLMTSRMEGQSLALIEAMYCNRTAIVTDVGGVRELIQDGINGFIADTPSVKDVDEAMERAWNRSNDWKHMGKKAGDYIRSVYPRDPVEYFTKQLFEIIK